MLGALLGTVFGAGLRADSSIGIIGGADGPTAIFVTGPVGDLMNALSLGARGMAGILAVMALIALIVWALPHLTAALEKKDQDNQKPEE